MPASFLSFRRLTPTLALLAAATALTAPARAQYAELNNTVDLTTTPLDVAITPNSQWAIVAAGSADGVQFYKLDGSIGGSWSIAGNPVPGARLIALTPNGNIAAVLAGNPSSAQFYDMTTAFPQPLAGYDFGAPGMDVAISPNGQFAIVACPGETGGIAVVSLPASTGALMFGGMGGLTTVPERMIAISPSSARVVVASSALETDDVSFPGIRVLDTSVNPPQILNDLPLSGEVHDVAISSDSAFAIVRSRSTAAHPDAEWLYIDLATGNEIIRIGTPTTPSGARSAAISPNRNHAAIFGGASPDDGTSFQWFDTAVLPFSGWSGMNWNSTPRDLAYSPDSSWLLGVENDAWLLLDLTPGGSFYGFQNDDGTYPANTAGLTAPTADNTKIMVAGRQIVWTVETCRSGVGGGAGYYQPYANPHQMVMAPDGRWVAVRAGAGPAAISFWGTQRWGEFDAFDSAVAPVDDASNSIAVSPDGRKVVAIGGSGAAGEVRIFTMHIPCPADYDGNESVQPADIAAFVSQWFDNVSNGGRTADANHNCGVEPADIATFVNTWFTALATGCNP